MAESLFDLREEARRVERMILDPAIATSVVKHHIAFIAKSDKLMAMTLTRMMGEMRNPLNFK